MDSETGNLEELRKIAAGGEVDVVDCLRLLARVVVELVVQVAEMRAQVAAPPAASAPKRAKAG